MEPKPRFSLTTYKINDSQAIYDVNNVKELATRYLNSQISRPKCDDPRHCLNRDKIGVWGYWTSCDRNDVEKRAQNSHHSPILHCVSNKAGESAAILITALDVPVDQMIRFLGPIPRVPSHKHQLDNYWRNKRRLMQWSRVAKHMACECQSGSTPSCGRRLFYGLPPPPAFHATTCSLIFPSLVALPSWLLHFLPKS